MSIVAIAGALSAFSPLIKSWLTDDDDDQESIAKVVVDVAQQVAGELDPSNALGQITSNAELQTMFHESLVARSNDIALLIKDRENARKNYALSRNATDAIAGRVMSYNLPLVILTVIVQVVATYLLRDNAALVSTVSTACGFIIKHLLDERKEITGFYFGGSLSPTEQPKILKKL